MPRRRPAGTWASSWSNFYHYELLSDFELATSFGFGGTPFDLAESGLRLYAKEVMPVVRSWR